MTSIALLRQLVEESDGAEAWRTITTLAAQLAWYAGRRLAPHRAEGEPSLIWWLELDPAEYDKHWRLANQALLADGAQAIAGPNEKVFSLDNPTAGCDSPARWGSDPELQHARAAVEFDRLCLHCRELLAVETGRRSLDPPTGKAAPLFTKTQPPPSIPQTKPPTKEAAQILYNEMIAGADPMPDADMLKNWAVEHGIAVRRLRELRRNCLDERLHKRGRHPKNPP